MSMNHWQRRGAPEGKQQQKAAYRGRKHHGYGEDGIEDGLGARRDAHGEVRGPEAQDEDEDDGDERGAQGDPQRAVIHGREEVTEPRESGGSLDDLHVGRRDGPREVGEVEPDLCAACPVGHVAAIGAYDVGVIAAIVEFLVEVEDDAVHLEGLLLGEVPLGDVGES